MDALLCFWMAYIPGFTFQYLQSSSLWSWGICENKWKSVEILPQAPAHHSWLSMLLWHAMAAMFLSLKDMLSQWALFHGKEQSISSPRVREDLYCTTKIWVPDIGTAVKLRWKTIEAPASCQGLAVSNRHLLHLHSKCLFFSWGFCMSLQRAHLVLSAIGQPKCSMADRNAGQYIYTVYIYVHRSRFFQGFLNDILADCK